MYKCTNRIIYSFNTDNDGGSCLHVKDPRMSKVIL